MIRTSYTFTNREYDEESGLYYYRARYYDASTGRFLQVDPDPGKRAIPSTHVNKYIYVGNNPHNNVDPEGKWSVGHIIALAVISVVAVVNEIVYVDNKERRNRNRGLLAGAAMLVITNGQYGWESMLYSSAFSAGMATIRADTRSGGDWEDYFWQNMATSFIASGASEWAFSTDKFFAPVFYAIGTGYGMGSNFEACRKKYRNDWSNGKVQGAACAGITYAGGFYGEPK